MNLEYQGVTGNGVDRACAAGRTRRRQLAGTPPTLLVDAAGAVDVTQAAREAMHRIDALVADNEAVLKVSLKNIETFSQALADNSKRIDRILSGAEGLIGTGTDQAGRHRASGACDRARRSVHLTAHSTRDRDRALARFSNSGLRQWERLAIDGRRRTLAEVDKMVKNIDRNPGRLALWRQHQQVRRQTTRSSGEVRARRRAPRPWLLRGQIPRFQ